MPTSSSLPPLLVRADGGPRIGLGHVARCLALAERWALLAPSADFLGEIEAESIVERLRTQGIGTHRSTGRPGSPEDLERTVATAVEIAEGSETPPWIVIDGYSFGPAFVEGIRAAGFRVVQIDDLAAQGPYAAEVVLNQNAGPERLVYDAEPSTVLLQGPRYALLRREFERQGDGEDGPRNRFRVLVTVGGAGLPAERAAIVQKVASADAPELAVLVAGGVTAGDEQDSASTGKVPVESRAVALDEMPALMSSVDLAVTAAGSTCWELAFLGVPAVTVQVADNQRVVAETIAAAGAGLDLGPIEAVSEGRIGGAVEAVLNDDRGRAKMAERGRQLVDGLGHERLFAVVRALEARSLEGIVHFRTATDLDIHPVWRLANEDIVREQSFGREVIPFDDHLAWWKATVSDPANLFLIGDVGGAVAAQVRYRREAESAEVHFAVAPPFRGKGLATAALKNTFETARSGLQVQKIRGVVLRSNKASIRAFHSAGYRETESVSIRGRDCLVMERSE